MTIEIDSNFTLPCFLNYYFYNLSTSPTSCFLPSFLRMERKRPFNTMKIFSALLSWRNRALPASTKFHSSAKSIWRTKGDIRCTISHATANVTVGWMARILWKLSLEMIAISVSSLAIMENMAGSPLSTDRLTQNWPDVVKNTQSSTKNTQ